MPRFDIINKDHETQKREKWKITNKRTITSSKLSKKGDLAEGIVTSIIGKNYFVELLDDLEFKPIECRRAGKIVVEHNNNSQIVAVGDRVRIELSDKSEELSTIVQVQNRWSSFSRMAIIGRREDVVATNADKILIVAAAAEPFYNKRMLDRMLIAADMGGIQAGLCINKIDMMPMDFLEEDLRVYKELGIPLFFISVHKQLKIDPVREFVLGATTIFSGQSGVGKSSLLNLLYGEELQRILEISDKSGKGRHTTSAATFIRVNPTTNIIDTPGLREFGLWDIKREELPLMFDDFEPFFADCKFMPCTHTHEPGCAVKAGVDSGEIDSERYQSYLNIFETLE